MDCIFCKIVAGGIPAVRLYEDEQTLAFMDIAPVVKGHALVIPKAHFDPLTATPPALLAACIATVQRIAQAQMTAMKADGVNIHQANGAAAGQVVPHLHFHIIPRFHGDGHHWNWHGGRYESTEEMTRLGERLRNAVLSAK
jgi:histidine triad (HIT) family protein